MSHEVRTCFWTPCPLPYRPGEGEGRRRRGPRGTGGGAGGTGDATVATARSVRTGRPANERAGASRGVPYGPGAVSGRR